MSCHVNDWCGQVTLFTKVGSNWWCLCRQTCSSYHVRKASPHWELESLSGWLIMEKWAAGPRLGDWWSTRGWTKETLILRGLYCWTKRFSLFLPYRLCLLLEVDHQYEFECKALNAYLVGVTPIISGPTSIHYSNYSTKCVLDMYFISCSLLWIQCLYLIKHNTNTLVQWTKIDLGFSVF